MSSILLANAAIPKERVGHELVYDSVNQKVILYGGDATWGDADPVGWRFDTWSYDYATNTWINMEPSSKPTATYVNLAYDSESEVVIGYGGALADHVVSNFTWKYDYTTNAWNNLNPTIDPPTGIGGDTIAYDSESDIIIAHGGHLGKDYNPAGYYPILINQTWAYDYNSNTWTNMTLASHPMGRNQHTMVYDSESDRIIMFGGYASVRSITDYPTGKTMGKGTWAYDYNTNTWENVTVNVNPEFRYGPMIQKVIK
jgi:hypothetical protein